MQNGIKYDKARVEKIIGDAQARHEDGMANSFRQSTVTFFFNLFNAGYDECLRDYKLGQYAEGK